MGLQRVLSMAIDRTGRVGTRRVARRAAAFRLRGGMEEVRAALGFRHPRETSGHDAAGARNDPDRIRPPFVEDHECSNAIVIAASLAGAVADPALKRRRTRTTTHRGSEALRVPLSRSQTAKARK